MIGRIMLSALRYQYKQAIIIFNDINPATHSNTSANDNLA